MQLQLKVQKTAETSSLEGNKQDRRCGVTHLEVSK